MKNLIIIITIFLLTGTASGQNQPFYYYKGEKIYLKEMPNKVFIKLSKEADKSRLLTLIQSDGSIQITSKGKTKETIGSFVVLESKDKGIIPVGTLDKYINSQDVVSALPMLEYQKGKTKGMTDEFIVKLKSGNSFEQLKNLAKEKLCVIVKENELTKNQFVLSVSKKSKLNALQFANLFYETGLFEYAEPSFFGFDVIQSNDPLFGNQWPLKNTGQNGGSIGADIKIEQAWTITEGRRDVKVAVIDEGVDLDHPDLSPNLLPGFDAVYGTSNGDADPSDPHGTPCAGIIAAVKDNGIGISGVAPGCKIIPIRAFTDNGGSDQQLADGINWAWQNNADVISNSWIWFWPSSAIDNAISDAVTYGRDGLGCVVLFASGNSGEYSDVNTSIEYPASLPNVIGVGATTKNDSRAYFSEWNFGLDVVAPGSEIFTTDIIGSGGYTSSDYNTDFTGTSAACPQAAGVAALILSVNRCLTWQQVKQILELSCDKVGSYCYNPDASNPNGSWNAEMGHGRINAYNAVQYAFSSDIYNFTNVGGPIDNTVNDPNSTFPMNMSAGCAGNASGFYYVQRHEVIINVTYPYTQAPFIVGTSNGYSPTNQVDYPTPNNGKYWMEAINVTPTSATLRTYVYNKFTNLGFTNVWFPTVPANVVFDYSVLSSMQPDIYLQNQTVTSGSQVNNAVGQIATGSNITTAVPYGDYVVTGNANITLHAGSKVTIDLGTAVSPGADGYFYAYVDPFFTCSQYPQGKNILSDSNDSETVNYFEDYDITFQKGQEVKSKEFQPKIYPVPFNDKLTIEYTIESSENVTISVCDLNGQELIQLKNKSPHEQGTYKIEFNGINLSTGIYLLKINTDNQAVLEKIVKIQ